MLKKQQLKEMGYAEKSIKEYFAYHSKKQSVKRKATQKKKQTKKKRSLKGLRNLDIELMKRINAEK